VLDRMRTLDARDPVLLPECEALFAAIGGNLREAIQIQRQAVEHDPRNAAALGTLALYLFHADRIDDAMALLRRELALNPHAPGSRGLLAVGLALRGRGADALAETAQEPHRGTRLWAQAIVHTLLGRRAESDVALIELRRDAAGADAYRVAQVYALRARPQPALEWLNRACSQPPSGCETLRIDRFFAGLRDDARLRALLARLKLDGEPPLPAR
jgi:tetratricopeptide (TPR) repeat protein